MPSFKMILRKLSSFASHGVPSGTKSKDDSPRCIFHNSTPVRIYMYVEGSCRDTHMPGLWQ